MENSHKKKQNILIVSHDAYLSICEQFERKLNNVGYRSKSIAGKNAMQNLLTKEADIIIIITDFSDEEVQLLNSNFNENRPIETPIVYISEKEDFATRVKAIELFGLAFLSLSDDDTLLLDTIENLLTETSSHQHVLIIDDDKELAEFYSLVLNQHNIKTTIANTSKKAFEILENNAIDLILLDYYLPDCNGAIFATLIRQMKEYVCLPIIFISSENTLNKITKNKLIGADECLLKPIDKSMLVETIIARTQRNNNLKQFMVKDHATGLLNHTTFKKELELEFSRAKRRQANFAYALLDLDHFKEVNDNYGHSAGDLALKFFAHVVKNRVRHTDIVSRYGGEEFAIIFLDSSALNAKKVLEEILQSLHTTKLEIDGHEFYISFSAGITEFNHFKEVNTLCKTADDALYLAKKNGRQQIIIGKP